MKRSCVTVARIAAAVLVTAALSLASCGDGGESPGKVDLARVEAILHPDSVTDNPHTARLDSMPNGGRRLHVNYPPGTLARVFNDSNYVHLAAATNIGIDPIDGAPDVWRMRRDVVRVESCPDYYIDDLTHSEPFLVPEAERLLRDIGRGFRDTLDARGGGAYRIKVTSLLRTNHNIKGLRRVNRNAVDSSTHRFATTFDISYAQFICDHDSLPRTQEDLKNLLGEILYDLREQGRCYVKYERKQACFHITTR